jgi:FMN phosphatase YigB (HAD superfamily)
MTRVATVLLDFGGTLDSDGLHWSTQFARAFDGAGLLVERATLDRAFLAADRELAAQPDIAELDLDRHVQRHAALMLGQLSSDPGPDPDLAARVTGVFLAAARTQLERSREVLVRYRGRFRYGMVSNFTPNLHRILEQTGLGGLFDAVLCSAIEGVAKPDPAIFRLALERLGGSEKSAAMVGDSLVSDIMPAKALGLTTCWIRGDRVFGRGDEGAADHVVGNLVEALERCAAA